MELTIPSGCILIWKGSTTSIPSGWYICDGNNGTPDLRDKFVVGAGSTYAVNATGGSATHTLSIEEMPVHNHRQTALSSTSGSVVGISRDSTASVSSDTANYTKNAGSGNPHNNLPPYYALAYIMKS